MHPIWKVLAAVALLALSGCALNGYVPRDYTGKDAGHLIFGFGAGPGTSYSSYTLYFRNKATGAVGTQMYLQQTLFTAPSRDFDDSGENGLVAIQRIPAGEYEIYNFNAYLNGGLMQSNFKSREDFSIPFTISPGKATYIGDFTANKITGKNLFGMTVSGGVYFVLSDKQSRDIPIAKRKVPDLGTIEVSVPDAAAVKNPLIQPQSR